MYLGWKTRYLNKNAYKDVFLLIIIYGKVILDSKELMKGKNSIFQANPVFALYREETEKVKGALNSVKPFEKIQQMIA